MLSRHARTGDFKFVNRVSDEMDQISTVKGLNPFEKFA